MRPAALKPDFLKIISKIADTENTATRFWEALSDRLCAEINSRVLKKKHFENRDFKEKDMMPAFVSDSKITISGIQW